AGAALPPEGRPRTAGAERAGVGRRRAVLDRPPPLLGAGSATWTGRRGDVHAAAPRPATVGAVGLRGPLRRATRAHRQGPSLHGRRARGGRARLAAAGSRAGARRVRVRAVATRAQTKRRAPAHEGHPRPDRIAARAAALPASSCRLARRRGPGG